MFRSRTIPCWVPLLVRLVHTILGVCCALIGTISNANEIELNIRLVWGGPQTASYTGTIEIDSGAVSCSQRLNIDPGQAGFVLGSSTRQLPIQDLQTRFGGMDITVRGEESSRLNVQLEMRESATTQPINKRFTWTLRELRDKVDVVALDDQGRRLSIDRVPGDRLRVQVGREHLVYNSNESLQLRIQPFATQWQDAQATLETSLIRSSDGVALRQVSQVITLDANGCSESFNVAIENAPVEEGVYELNWTLTPKTRLPHLVFRHGTSLKRATQFIVYNETRSAARQSTETKVTTWLPLDGISVSSIRLSQTDSDDAEAAVAESYRPLILNRLTRPNRWFPNLRTDARTDSKEMGTTAEASEFDDGRAIPPAYRATIELDRLSPGRMHRLRLQTTDQQSPMLVRLMAAAPNGSSTKPLFMATVEPALGALLASAESDRKSQSSFVFWPTQTALRLEITNLGNISTIQLDDVGVDVRGPTNSESSKVDAAWAMPSARASLAIRGADLRKFAGDPFASLDPSTKHRFDDWQSFLQLADCLSEYCHAAGFGTVRLSVYDTGAALYPSNHLKSSLAMDTGKFFSDARDPVRKDVVELFYRVLGRANIAFVPEFVWNAPLPDIETARLNVGDGDLLQCEATNAAVGQANLAAYNPLSMQVQQDVARCIDEFKRRYQSKSNYDGFGFVVDQSSWLEPQWPITEMNASILAKYSAQAGASLPRVDSDRRMFIANQSRASFLEWYRSQVTTWCKSLTESIWIESQTNAMRSDTNSNVNPKFLKLQIDAPEPERESHRSAVGRFHEQNVALRCMLGSLAVERLQRLRMTTNEHNGRVAVWQSMRGPATRSIRSNRVGESSIAETSAVQLLIVNSGASDERLQLDWDNLPKNYSMISTIPLSQSQPRIIEDIAQRAWSVTIPKQSCLIVHSNATGSQAIGYRIDTSALRSRVQSSLHELEQAVNRLSVPQPSVRQLTNSSFEDASVGVAGRLPGWTASLLASHTISRDDSVAAVGTSSLKVAFHEPGQKAWIQSDPWTPTTTDRLAITMQCKVNELPTEWNVSLWAYRADMGSFEQVSMQSVLPRLRESNAQRDWREVTIDLSPAPDNLPIPFPTPFRIQFDIQGSGTMWIDSVVVSHDFLTENERRELRSELYVANQGLAQGDIDSAQSMLQSNAIELLPWADRSVQKRDAHTDSKSGSAAPASIAKPNSEPSNSAERTTKRRRAFWWTRKSE